jgi:hypothetical protein
MTDRHAKRPPPRDASRAYSRAEIDELYRAYLKAVAAEMAPEREARRRGVVKGNVRPR